MGNFINLAVESNPKIMQMRAKKYASDESVFVCRFITMRMQMGIRCQ